MSAVAYRGVVEGGKVVMLGDTSALAEGTEVLVTPARASGTAAAVLAAMAGTPAVAADWVDELESLIVEGRRPARASDLFPEEPNDEDHD